MDDKLARSPIAYGGMEIWMNCGVFAWFSQSRKDQLVFGYASLLMNELIRKGTKKAMKADRFSCLRNTPH